MTLTEALNIACVKKRRQARVRALLGALLFFGGIGTGLTIHSYLTSHNVGAFYWDGPPMNSGEG